MSPRIIVRIELTPNAKECVNEMCERRGMTQVALLSRLVEWFSKQPEILQVTALELLPPDIAPDIARLALKSLAGPKGVTQA